MSIAAFRWQGRSKICSATFAFVCVLVGICIFNLHYIPPHERKKLPMLQTRCIYFAAFADLKFSVPLKAITREAWNLDIFEKVFAYTDSDLGQEFDKKHRVFVTENSRGYGYWIWKPYVVEMTLKKMPENCFLVYADVGCHIFAGGRNRSLEYIKMMVEEDKHVLGFRMPQSEREWTKKDLFVYMNATKSMEDSGQVMATIFIVRNSPQGRGFVRQWKSIMEANYDLITDKPSLLTNDASFKEHRHDQSVFSLLIKTESNITMTIPDETQSSSSPFQSVRNKSPSRIVPPAASRRIARKESEHRVIKLAERPTNEKPIECRRGFHAASRRRFWRFFGQTDPSVYDAFARGAVLRVVLQTRADRCSRCLISGKDMRLDYSGTAKQPSWHCDFGSGEPRVVAELAVDPHGHALVISCAIPPAVLARTNSTNIQTVTLAAEADGEVALIYQDVEYCTYLPESHAAAPIFLAGCTMLRSRGTSDNADRLLEWLAYHRLQGFGHFLIYSDGDPAPVRGLLQGYISEGVVEVVDWEWPDSGFHHQQAQLQSCLYRNRGAVRWLAFFDMDEFFQPLLTDTLNGTVADVLRRVPGDIGGLMALHFYFISAPVPLPGGAGTDSTAAEVLITQRSLVRSALPLEAGTRSKCIVRPDNVNSMGVHLVTDGGRTVVADPTSELRLNHYKGSSTLELPTNDSSMNVFGQALLAEVCRLIPSLKRTERIEKILSACWLEKRLDCFDYSTCVLMHHKSFGRSGNSKIQLGRVQDILSRCSGVALATSKIRDDVVHFAPMKVYGKTSCRPIWNQLPDMEGFLDRLTSRCQRFHFDWSTSYPGMKCLLQSPPAFHPAHLDSRFPSWLEISLDAWAVPVDATTAVIHFRGGDIFRRPGGGGIPSEYTQPVCDHYIQSFRHSGAACALLVAEDDANPCLATFAASFNCTRRLPPDCGPACAFTLLARARVVIASRSTFADAALESFDGAERRVYKSYCSDCPQRSGQKTVYCTEVNRTELFPWRSDERQLELLRTRPARMVLC